MHWSMGWWHGAAPECGRAGGAGGMLALLAAATAQMADVPWTQVITKPALLPGLVLLNECCITTVSRHTSKGLQTKPNAALLLLALQQLAVQGAMTGCRGVLLPQLFFLLCTASLAVDWVGVPALLARAFLACSPMLAT